MNRILPISSLLLGAAVLVGAFAGCGGTTSSTGTGGSGGAHPSTTTTGGAGGCNMAGEPDCGEPPDTCSISTCVDHVCGTSPAPAGAQCHPNGGVCDGMGGCVGCLADADCTDPTMSVCDTATSTCTSSCADGKKDGTETDVDCGGGNGCMTCVTGKHCAMGTDCASGTCTAGVCG